MPSNRRTIMLLLGVAGFLGVTARASAQYAPGMSGRANDANNQLGSGGINSPSHATYFNTANLYVTGNVAGGRGFRGYSPIRDPSAIMLSLPSQRIDSFRSDSVGLDQINRTRPLLRYSPFFSPSGTVTSANAINARLNQPGSSVPLSTSTIPFGATPSNPGLQVNDLQYGAPLTSPVAPNSSIYTPQNLPLLRDLYGYGAQTDPAILALRASPLFSASTSTTRPLQRAYETPTGIEDPYALNVPRLERRSSEPIQLFSNERSEKKSSPSSEDMLMSSSLLVSPTQIAPKLFDQERTPLADRDTLTGRPLPTPPPYLATPEEAVLDPLAARDLPTQTAGAMGAYGSGTVPFAEGELAYGEESVFPGLAAAVQTINELAPPAAGNELPRAPGLQEQYERAVSLVRGVSARPTESFAGDKSSRVGQLVARAEQLVHKGDYYQASTVYELASAMAPGDALIKLGQGHALLAAGEYLTAVQCITSAIEQYPAIAFLNFNLYTFVPEPNVLEIRRADLEDHLSHQEDYRLRFLLGYVEYFSGLEKFGLPDLERAAANAPTGSVIARFPDMLKNATRVKSAARAAASQPAAEPPASDDGQ